MNHRAWILTLDLFELSIRSRLVLARNKFIKSVAKAYSDGGVIPANAMHEHESNVRNILAAHYSKVTAVFRGRQKRDIGIKSLQKKALSNYDALIAEWITTEAYRKAKMIAGTNHQDIIDAIEDGILEGSTLPEIARGIRNQTGMSAVRANTIARTETHNAATYAVIESVREVEAETGVKFMKQWIPTNDSRTRDRHSEMIGSDPIPVDEKFYVGGEYLDRPSDPSGSPENVINCRCQVIFSEQ